MRYTVVTICCVVVFITISSIWCQRRNFFGPLVQTKSGKIRGHYLTSYKGNKYEAYQGIPFALSPVGERRFQPPVPVKPWSEELQATKLKDPCAQISRERSDPNGSEDCLHLNVYVPRQKKINSSLPVIFYIYGGGFRAGSTNDGDERFIIDYNVIFASVNYRSGVLGFLSTEDEVVPGNMGLKDQSTALRWLYDNIEHFGGDPKRITLLGGSSGATSIHYHYMSPWSAGLFNAGISMSGCALLTSAMAENSRDKTMALGRLVNCTDNDMSRMVNCLKNTPVETLLNAYWTMKPIEGVPMSPSLFGPIVERSGDNPFINDSPIQLLKQGKVYDVPWVTGIVAQEGLIYTADFYRNKTWEIFNKKWDSLAPLILGYEYSVPVEDQAKLSQTIRKHYFADKPISRQNFRALTDVLGHRIFSVGVVNAARIQAATIKSPVYFYYYNYRSVDSLSHSRTNSTEDLGVSHGDDTLLVIGNVFIMPTKSLRDMAMQKRLIEMIVSVAYTSIPDVGVEWPRVSPNITDPINYLILAGPDDLKSASSNDLVGINFWNSIGLGGL